VRQALYKQGLRHQTIWRGCKVRSSTCFLRRLICFHDEGSPKRRNVELTFTLSTRAPYACTTPQARTRGHLSSSWESKDIKEASSSLPTPCLNVEAFTSPLSFVPASSLPAHLFDHALREPPSRNLPACPHPLHHHYHRRSSPPPPPPPSPPPPLPPEGKPPPPVVVFTMPPQPSNPSFWQRCRSCILFPFLAPFLFAHWFWHLLPFTDKTQQPGQQRRKRRSSNSSSSSSNSDNITDFRPPPRWLLRLLSLPLALFNPPDARHLEHVIGCLDRGEKILLVGNQVGREGGREGGR